MPVSLSDRCRRRGGLCVLVMLCVAGLFGCSVAERPVSAVSTVGAQPSPAAVSSGASSSSAGATSVPTAPAGTDSRLSQCTRELEALKTFDDAKYRRYQAQMARITRTGAQYLAVSGGISQEINDLVQPRYQYALTSLCQQVRADLSFALINQVAIK
ncbi:hypothetical protein NGI13_22300 [Enterobacter asburiae]|uniref:hypothetical protein n=1 Tax=Enterobacter TaxID=547 RepID=UPI0004DB4BD9|nr:MULTISPECIES: hypothetical protein [Enterobacter]KFA84182.1 hypothetical protein N037_22195 [Enterobacter sp. EGD-HP1]MEB8258286.1 hypothetical protein [Enterobacter asburiae]